MAILSRREGCSINKRTASKKNTSPSHKSSLWSGAIAILLLSFFAFFRLLGDQLYDYPPNPAITSIPQHSVIVSLAGGKGRIETAFELFANGTGEELFIIGAGPKTTLNSLIKILPKELIEKLDPLRREKIYLETESRNTIENSYAITHRLKKIPIDNIILITSSYHMRRSLLILQNSLGSAAKITPFTPEKESINKGNWFRTWLGIEITAYEYAKYLFVRIMLPYFGSF